MNIDIRSKLLLITASSVFIIAGAIITILLSDQVIAKTLAVIAALISGILIGSIRSIAENDWRNIEVEIPQQRGRYLVNLNGSVVDVAHFANGAWQQDKADFITHWKPLPHKPSSLYL
ncbi:hypothetical protein LMH73_014420 [Vibrio splendidus]|nr:hypothetical protein [Vibrio splendidus]MCC4882511.1 hypothetical protein [Vibrio splendidus]